MEGLVRAYSLDYSPTSAVVDVHRFLRLAPFDDKNVWRQQVEKGMVLSRVHINSIVG